MPRDLQRIITNAAHLLRRRPAKASSPIPAVPVQPAVLAQAPPGRPTDPSSTPCTAAPDTLYQTLEHRLKSTRHTRARDFTISHEQRWILRGAFLVLWMAIQACPCSDSYDVWRAPRVERVDAETALWHGILEGAEDEEKMRAAAERLVEMVWPGEDVCVLVQVGRPEKVWREEEFWLGMREVLLGG